MTGSRADGHDLDKLERWRSALQEGEGAFPVHALFLVSEADASAHRAFRAFRSSFEARDASFQHLVIFGQHGVSTTAVALAREVGTECPPPPVLVLLHGASPSVAYTVPLPAGDEPGCSTSASALSAVEAWIDERSGIDPTTLLGARRTETRHSTIAGLVERVAAELAAGGGRA